MDDGNQYIIIKKILKHVNPIVISIIMLVIAAVLAWFIPKYFDNQTVEINIQELSLSDERYIYLIDIENVGKSFVQNVDLSFLVSGQVHSSMFNNRSTTHDPYYIVKKSPFNGNVEIKNKNSKRTVTYPFSNDTNANETISTNNIAQKALNSKSQIWYQININPFNLPTKKIINASIITKSKIDRDKVKCNPDPKLCSVNNIKVISKYRFNRLLDALSVQQGNVSNKVFGTGLGISNIMIKGAAIHDAKQKAIQDFYRDVTEKLYGVSVKSEVTSNSVRYAKPNSKKLIYKSDVIISSEGIIDRELAIIYDENVVKLENGAIAYEVKGYYELPEKIKMNNFYHEIDSSFAFSTVPMELEGKRPRWLDDSFTFDNSVIVYSIGVSDEGLPYPLAKRIAKSRALSQLSEQHKVKLKIKIKTTKIDDNISNIDTNNIIKTNETVNKKSDNIVIGSQVIAYYKQDDGTVYALVIIPNYALESINETHLKTTMKRESDLWKEFKANKSSKHK